MLSDSPRDRIIATALKLFYSQGYLATGINQVIAEAGVAKATFYHHFRSKEELCVEYLQARHLVWMGWLRGSINQHRDPVARVLGLFDFLSQWMSDCRFRGCAFLNIASEVPESEHRIRHEVQTHKDSLRSFITRQLNDLVAARSQLQRLDVAATSDMLYVLMEGAIAASQNYNATWPIASARDAARHLLGLEE